MIKVLITITVLLGMAIGACAVDDNPMLSGTSQQLSEDPDRTRETAIESLNLGPLDPAPQCFHLYANDPEGDMPAGDYQCCYSSTRRLCCSYTSGACYQRPIYGPGGDGNPTQEP